MEIHFPYSIKPKATAAGTVCYQASVDGEIIWCEISLEALRMHFDAPSSNGDDLVDAFNRGRTRIEAVTRRYLEAGGGRAVLLRTVDFW